MKARADFVMGAILRGAVFGWAFLVIGQAHVFIQ